MKKILIAAFIALLPALAYAGTAKPLVLQNGQPANLPSGTTLQLNAGTTGAAPLNVGQGSAPSSPNNGDCWITTSGLFCRYNGSTVGPFGTGSGSGSVTTTGSPANGNLTKFSGATSITNGDLSGDCTTSGTLAITCAKINGTSVPASPSTHQTPVVTSSNTASWKTIPDCTDTGGNHLNYTQSTDAYSCGTSGGGATIPTAVSMQPWWPPASANAMDDEFTAGSLNTGLWTWVNQGTRTATLGNSWLTLAFTSPGSGDNWGFITQPTPSTPWTVEALVSWQGETSLNFTYGGLILRESSTGKFISFGFDNSSLNFTYWTNTTTFSSQPTSISYGSFKNDGFRGFPLYLKIQDDGTNIVAYTSTDGVHFQTFTSQSRTAFLAGGPNQVGLGIGTNIGVGTAKVDFDFFRRTQ